MLQKSGKPSYSCDLSNGHLQPVSQRVSQTEKRVAIYLFTSMIIVLNLLNFFELIAGKISFKLVAGNSVKNFIFLICNQAAQGLDLVICFILMKLINVK